MPIPRDFIDELLSRTDITELVGSYVRLKKGGSNMKGLCPFHTEKTPSFSVNSDMQIYKCFGCGKGGGAINFIMEIENLPYREAIEVLARRAGMTIPEDDGNTDYASRRKRIIDLNRAAAKHFHQMLVTAAGATAREYLAKRGISKESVVRFGLGVAIDDWGVLLDAMTKKGYTKQELLDAGLCRRGQKEGSVYDFFRGRLMFPVIDVRGDVVAFSGRSLDADAKSYKYLNSPDTIAFSKGRHLFGLNIARKTKAGYIILVEGNVDTVMLHQAGYDNTVAQLGSAFTPEQARLLAHYTDNVILAFDGDEAGRNATLKTLPLIEATGKSVRVIDLGDSDPDDFIKKHGPEAFGVLIKRGENHAEYRLQTILGKNDISTDAGRLAYLAEATQYLLELTNIPEREIYSAKVAKTAGVSVDAVRNEIRRLIKKRQAKTKNDPRKAANRPREAVQPLSKKIRYKNEASAVAEEGVIRCLMKDRTLEKNLREMEFTAQEFTSEFLAKIFTSIESRLQNDKEIVPSLIMAELEPEEATQLTAIIEKPESLSEGERSLKEYVGKIRTERYKRSKPNEEMFLEIVKLRKEERTGHKNG